VNVYTPFILPESQWLFYAFSKLRTLLYSIESNMEFFMAYIYFSMQFL